ncbi:MAG: ankyrin repeat domain-containing protein [Burkholderiales bacterium]
MGGHAARLLTYVFTAIVALALTGCAGVGMAPGSGVDDDRFVAAIDTDDVRFVRSAVESGAINVNQRIAAPGYPDGAPLIALAARSASLEILRFLISARADLNARTPVNETPLMLAAYFLDGDQSCCRRPSDRYERAVRMLVEAGASLENIPYQYTPLAYAAYQGNERIVRYLIERGARVNADAQRGGTYINTPLMMAAMQGHEQIVRSLLRAGADADVRVYGGNTAAEFAAKYNHRALAQLLQCAQRRGTLLASSGQCRQILGNDIPAESPRLRSADGEPRGRT